MSHSDKPRRQIADGQQYELGRDVFLGERVPVDPRLAFGVAPELARLLGESAPAQPFDYRPLVSIQAGGVLYTEYLDTVVKHAVYPKLTRWQRLLRTLTPPRWRKPQRPLSPIDRHQRMLASTLHKLDKLGIKPEDHR